ncbi:hypothetical protein N7454_008226 [Penicillium verhagenii]|nr:hypothetical protein N7454_008226 [Penicillium verhagenii]
MPRAWVEARIMWLNTTEPKGSKSKFELYNKRTSYPGRGMGVQRVAGVDVMKGVKNVKDVEDVEDVEDVKDVKGILTTIVTSQFV